MAMQPIGTNPALKVNAVPDTPQRETAPPEQAQQVQTQPTQRADQYTPAERTQPATYEPME